MLTPGKLRIIELAEACDTSRTTAEKMVSRFSLTPTTVLYMGREVAGVDLNEEDISKISAEYPGVLKDTSNSINSNTPTLLQPNHNPNDNLVQELRLRIDSLENEKRSLLNKLSDWKVVEAKLSSALDREKDINEQLLLRLSDKDALISSLQNEAEAQKQRAEALNNQVSTNNSMVQYNKGAAANFEELTDLFKKLSDTQNELKEEVLAIKNPNENKMEPDKKPKFKLFGFELSRS